MSKSPKNAVFLPKKLHVGIDLNSTNADVTWQELQSIADRVRILSRIVKRLSGAVDSMLIKARINREEKA